MMKYFFVTNTDTSVVRNFEDISTKVCALGICTTGSMQRNASLKC